MRLRYSWYLIFIQYYVIHFDSKNGQLHFWYFEDNYGIVVMTGLFVATEQLLLESSWKFVLLVINLQIKLYIPRFGRCFSNQSV